MFFSFSLSPLLSLTFFILLTFLPNLASTTTIPTKIGKGYSLISIQKSPNGGLLGLLQVKLKNNIYGPDIPLLQLYVKHETDNRLRVHITDAQKQRWEIPYNLLPRETPPKLNFKQTRPENISEYSGKDLIFAYTPDVRNIGIKTPLLLTKSSPTAHQKLTKLSTTKHTLSILYIQCYIHPFIMGICNNHHLSWYQSGFKTPCLWSIIIIAVD
ncbi:hypothetical protein CASFOL_020639 [Castilleja foliolosa]|uniref:Galactose mutarotase N-terminal barrel domain-containing protein n=1 Tax=Castilleja foliolosa TaxID=1961234 RepID=A0ABD3D5P7_9LAMI